MARTTSRICSSEGVERDSFCNQDSILHRCLVICDEKSFVSHCSSSPWLKVTSDSPNVDQGVGDSHGRVLVFSATLGVGRQKRGNMQDSHRRVSQGHGMKVVKGMMAADEFIVELVIGARGG